MRHLEYRRQAHILGQREGVSSLSNETPWRCEVGSLRNSHALLLIPIRIDIQASIQKLRHFVFCGPFRRVTWILRFVQEEEEAEDGGDSVTASADGNSFTRDGVTFQVRTHAPFLATFPPLLFLFFFCLLFCCDSFQNNATRALSNAMHIVNATHACNATHLPNTANDATDVRNAIHVLHKKHGLHYKCATQLGQTVQPRALHKS